MLYKLPVLMRLVMGRVVNRLARMVCGSDTYTSNAPYDIEAASSQSGAEQRNLQMSAVIIPDDSSKRMSVSTDLVCLGSIMAGVARLMRC